MINNSGEKLSVQLGETLQFGAITYSFNGEYLIFWFGDGNQIRWNGYNGKIRWNGYNGKIPFHGFSFLTVKH